MQISAQKLNPKIATTIEQYLLTVISELRSNTDVENFLHDFLTETERVVLVKRLAIAVLLQKGQSYEEIKKALKVSSATISFVSERLKNPGFQTALEKIDEDEWAEDFLKKFSLFS